MRAREEMPGSLPDGTASANASDLGSQDVTAADLKRGYKIEPVERTGMFDPDEDGGATSKGSIFEFGGVCGRPQGFAR